MTVTARRSWFPTFTTAHMGVTGASVVALGAADSSIIPGIFTNPFQE